MQNEHAGKEREKNEECRVDYRASEGGWVWRKVCRTGVSGLVARGARRGARAALVAGADAAKREAEPRRRRGAGGQKVGVVPELLYEGAAAEFVPREMAERLKAEC